jgi:hypothetical protein
MGGNPQSQPSAAGPIHTHSILRPQANSVMNFAHLVVASSPAGTGTGPEMIESHDSRWRTGPYLRLLRHCEARRGLIWFAHTLGGVNCETGWVRYGGLANFELSVPEEQAKRCTSRTSCRNGDEQRSDSAGTMPPGASRDVTSTPSLPRATSAAMWLD